MARATLPLGDSASVDVAKLRVAYYTDDGTLTVAPAVRRAVIEAAGALAGRGAQVQEWRPSQPQRGADIFFGLLGADGGASEVRTLGRDKRDPRIAQLLTAGQRARAGLASLVGGLRARAVSDISLRGRAQLRLSAHGALLAAGGGSRWTTSATSCTRWITDDGGPFDVIICPAFSLPALRHGASKDLRHRGRLRDAL